MCGENELGVCICSQTLPQWLDQFSKETFWVVSVQPIHEAVENVMRKQNVYITRYNYVILCITIIIYTLAHNLKTSF